VAELSPYALRLALYLVLMLLFGRLLFVRPGLPRGISLALAVVALILVVTDAASRLSGVLGISPFDIDGETARWFLTGTPVGEAGLLRILALLAMLPLLAVKRPVQGLRRLALLAFSAATLASLAWNGHAAAGDGLAGRLRLATGIVHLLAAGAWVGAIAALLQLALRRQGLRLRERTYELWQAAHSFAVPGTIIVALLAMTGTYTYVDLGGSIQTLTGAAHGRWLLLKLALVGGMLGLAALHRLRLVPALASSIRGGWQLRPLRSLRHSLACESVLAVLVLACVAVLGTLDPLA
jgi:copper resistance protein D